MIVHINSYPGVGKLTIAQELVELIGGRLLDNHTIYNVALALTERNSEPYYDALRAVRKIAFDLVLRLPPDEPVVLTNAHFVDSDWGNENWDAVKALAGEREVPLYVVVLNCSPEENARRIQGQERAEKRKPRDQATFTGNANGRPLLDRDGHYTLRLDVTDLAAPEAANRIAAWLKSVSV
ncbi:MAG: AAA family ATPase [Pseudomonadota bacterium]